VFLTGAGLVNVVPLIDNAAPFVVKEYRAS
jgi:hypothetical protein